MGQLSLEHKVLILLYLLSYFFAMFIQVRDPKTDVDFIDWVLAFIASLIGGIITYFISIEWLNLGYRMGATILVSLVSYRTLTFMVSSESQDAFARGFFNGILHLMSNLFNYKNNNDGNN